MSMGKAIYEQIVAALSPDFQETIKAIDKAPAEQKEALQDAFNKSQASWQKLADAIAKGVVEYISQHMTISGIKTKGVVAGQTAADDPVGHQHTINLKIEGPTAFVQSNDGTGHVGWVDDDKDHA